MNRSNKFGALLILLVGLALGMVTAASAETASGGVDFVTPYCECKCGADKVPIAAHSKESCESFNAAACETTAGERKKLTECAYLYVAEEPSADEPPAATSPPPAGAKRTWFCQEGQSWDDCEDKHLNVEGAEPTGREAPKEDKAAKASKEEIEHRAKLSLGGSSPSGASTKNNFLQRFLATIDLPGLTEEEGLLSFRYNPPGGIFGLEAAAKKPELFGKLKGAIPEADRATKSAELEKGLGNFDDIGFKLSVNIRPQNSLMGQGTDYRKYSSALMTEALKETEGKNTAEKLARFAYLNAFRRLKISPESNVEQAGPHREELDGLSQKMVEASQAWQDAYLREIGAAGVFQLADLVANQPQFTLEIKGQTRDDLIGPDNIEAMLALEVGIGANFNMLKRVCAAGELECFKKFLADHGDAVEKKWRFKVEAGYKETDAYKSPVDGVTLDLAKAESLIAKATFGGVLTFTKDEEGKTVELNSFALEAAYDDVTGDEERQNRFIATATLTQRVDDDMSLQVSFVWANKPEYLGDVEEEISARAGIRYKFYRPE